MIFWINVRAEVKYYKFSYIGLEVLICFEMIIKLMISDVMLVDILRG